MDLRKAILAEVVCGETSQGLAVVRTPAVKTYDLPNVNSRKFGSRTPYLKLRHSGDSL